MCLIRYHMGFHPISLSWLQFFEGISKFFQTFLGWEEGVLQSCFNIYPVFLNFFLLVVRWQYEEI